MINFITIVLVFIPLGLIVAIPTMIIIRILTGIYKKIKSDINEKLVLLILGILGMIVWLILVNVNTDINDGLFWIIMSSLGITNIQTNIFLAKLFFCISASTLPIQLIMIRDKKK